MAKKKTQKKVKKIILKFIRNSQPYVKGDVAGFDKDIADRYIELGIAKIKK